jgi:iron complex outermembrane receptor protein
MKKVYILTTLLLSISIAFAQSDSAITIQRRFQLEEVSVMTIRAERTWPVTETFLDTKQIEYNYVGQEMPVMLARTPSVNWHSDGGNYTGYMYLRLRGIDQTRVNFTLNGVPLNEPEDQGAYFSNYPDFLNSVRSIQVQRGVGISTNGTASFAGSVNMETPSLYDSAYVELNSTYGSYKTYRLSPEFHTGLLKNNWSFYGRYSNTGSDGFREHSGTKGQSFFFSGGYTGKTAFKFTTFTGMSKNQMAYLAIPDSILKRDYRANSLTKDENDDFRQSLVMAQITSGLSNYSSLHATAYYTYLQGGYSILFTPDLYNYSVKSDFYGLNLNYQFMKKAWNISAGINASNYVRYHSSALLPYEDALLYKNAGYKSEASAFLKVAYTLRRFVFFGDAQYRVAQFRYQPDKQTGIGNNSVSWSFFNPKAGISYRFGGKHLLYVSVAQTGREPTRNDLFAGYDNMDSTNLTEIGNFNRVKPESVTDVEAGIKLLFANYQINLNVYDMEFKNEIAAIGQLSYIGLPLRKNVTSSYRRGIELNMILEPLRGLILSTQANLSTNRIKSYTTDYDSVTYINVQPLLTPQAIVHQSVAYRFANWLGAEVNARYLSSAFLDNTSNTNYKVPASLICSASLNITFLKKHSISLMANNIFDQQYYTSGYVQGSEPHYFAMATRNYAATLKLRF